jgi:hypothetical protein
MTNIGQRECRTTEMERTHILIDWHGNMRSIEKRSRRGARMFKEYCGKIRNVEQQSSKGTRVLIEDRGNISYINSSLPVSKL